MKDESEPKGLSQEQHAQQCHQGTDRELRVRNKVQRYPQRQKEGRHAKVGINNDGVKDGPNWSLVLGTKQFREETL